MPNNKTEKLMPEESIPQVFVMVLKSFKNFFNDSTMI